MMPIEQVVFEIPAEIKVGLSNGSLIRRGGVVRDPAGRIVKHLKEISPSKLDKAFAYTRQYKIVITGTAVAAVIGGTVLAVKAKKHRKVKKLNEQLEAAVSAYFTAIADQNMTFAVVDQLYRALSDLREATGFSSNELIDKVSMEALIGYSRDFILHNAPEHLAKAQIPQQVSIEDYLTEQRKIFNEEC